MKIIIIALCFVAAIAAQKVSKPSGAPSKPPKIGEGGDGRERPTSSPGTGKPECPPGCCNAPKDVKMSDCCTNFPKFFSKEVMAQNCSQSCATEEKGQKMCCTTDCVMNAFGVLSDGKFDATKAKAAIAKMNADNKAWTSEIIAGVVDNCVAVAPSKVAEWRSKAPAEMVPKCSEATSLNMVIGHCIRRELFFQCPGLSTTDSCKALVDFGKGCSFFPFHDGAPGSYKQKTTDKSDSKSSRGQTTQEKKDSKDQKATTGKQGTKDKPATGKQDTKDKPATGKQDTKDKPTTGKQTTTGKKA